VLDEAEGGMLKRERLKQWISGGRRSSSQRDTPVVHFKTRGSPRTQRRIDKTDGLEKLNTVGFDERRNTFLHYKCLHLRGGTNLTGWSWRKLTRKRVKREIRILKGTGSLDLVSTREKVQLMGVGRIYSLGGGEKSLIIVIDKHSPALTWTPRPQRGAGKGEMLGVKGGDAIEKEGKGGQSRAGKEILKLTEDPTRKQANQI